MKRTIDDVEYYKQIAQDPGQAIAEVEDAAKDYVDNFDARNQGQVEATIAVAILTRKVGPGGASAATSRVKGVWDRVRQWFNPKCFAAGTLVLTTTGMVPIEDIGVGDLVYSRDDVTHEESYQPVLQTFETPDKAVWDVEFTTDTGGSEILTATYGHPFWVVGDGWTHTEDLEVGMEVSTANDGIATVVSLSLVDADQTVYNFEVLDTHNYFVGDAAVWVHNTGSEGPERKPWRIDNYDKKITVGGHVYMRDNTTVRNYWWSPDTAGHYSGKDPMLKPHWKVYRQDGKNLVWHRDADWYGDFISPDAKHKSDVGKIVKCP